MSLISDNVQIGQNATATQNFTLKQGADGTCTLARGNIGATTQDVLTVDANGIVSHPLNIVPAFCAVLGTDQSVSTGVATLMTLNVELFDTANCFDTGTYRFTPTVAGYYQITASSRGGTSSITLNETFIYKNGAVYCYERDTGSAGASPGGVSCLIHMNGSTDYIELWASVTATTPVIRGTNDCTATYMCGYLAVRA